MFKQRNRHLSTLYFDDATDGLKLEHWLDLEHGSWYRIAIEGVQQILELQLGNVWTDTAIGLVNEKYPQGRANLEINQPMDSGLVEIRWARRLEFLSKEDGSYSCQSGATT